MSQVKQLLTYRIACVLGCAGIMVAPCLSDESPTEHKKLHQPVYRVAKHPDPATLEKSAAPETEKLTTKPTASNTVDRAEKSVVVSDAHPLDAALDIARKTLEHIDSNIKDYTCTLVKRERINGTLMPHEFMTCKIRHQQADGTPFSVYLHFRKPSSMKGREVIYVQGENSGKLVAHEGGFKSRFLPTVSLNPTSGLAMRNQRYPITEIGLRTLTERLIEKGERDRALGPCKVRILKGAKVGKRVCTCIEVRHDDRRPQLDFHIARVFVDDEYQLPIRYEAYEWPVSDGGKMQLIEEYTYLNLKLNVGLTDEDFDRNNSKYNF